MNELASSSIPNATCSCGYTHDEAHNRQTACGVTFGFQTNEALNTEGPITYGPDAGGNQLKDGAGNQLKWDSLSRWRRCPTPPGR